ncbi:MAG: hypothetical protein DWQ10_09745 [Calditrichaeota bacterium]|nr:MAG: hypothetical protein DWQ10_09745 [Calditrichota bacterium]
MTPSARNDRQRAYQLSQFNLRKRCKYWPDSKYPQMKSVYIKATSKTRGPVINEKKTIKLELKPKTSPGNTQLQFTTKRLR